MITRIKTIAIKAKVLPRTAKKYLHKLEMGTAGAIAITGFAGNHMVQTIEYAQKNISAQRTIAWEKATAQAAKLNKEMIVKKAQQALFQKQKTIVLKIMNDDKNCAAGIDKDKIATQIVLFAKEYKVNPITIACIAKQETHFTENLNGTSGKGIMQVTSVAVKDLFQRSSDYNEKLVHITNKHQGHKELFQAIQNKSSLNMRVGIILFQRHLDKNEGNLYKALRDYNSGAQKDQYARTISNDIQKYMHKYMGNPSAKSSI